MNDKHGNEITVGDTVRGTTTHMPHDVVGTVKATNENAVDNLELTVAQYSDASAGVVLVTVPANADEFEIVATRNERNLDKGPFKGHRNQRDATAKKPGHPTTPTTPGSTPAQPGSPAIVSFAPTSGPAGTSVSIQGTALDGGSVVTFAGQPGTIQTTSPTSVVATVPVPIAGQISGPITVTTPAGTATSQGSFTTTV